MVQPRYRGAGPLPRGWTAGLDRYRGAGPRQPATAGLPPAQTVVAGDGPENLPTGLGGLVPPQPQYSDDDEWRASRTVVSERRADEKGQDVETPALERRAHVIMGVLSEALQVMSLLLLKALVEVLLVKALLKVAEVFSLSSPLTQPPTTMPQTRPGGA